MNTKTKPKFKLGQIVATPGAFESFERNNTSGREYLGRHLKGDWGVVSDEDGYLNDMAVEDGSRILSVYVLPDETKIWIITEAEVDDQHNREVTTFLLPGEY
jgi:hypothetical protein